MNFESKLLSQLEKSQSIKELIEETSVIIGNPIIVADSSFRILYATNSSKLNGIEIWDKAKDTKYISSIMIDEMKNTNIMEMLENGECTRSNMSNGYTAIRMPIIIRNHFYGFIGVYNYEKDFSKHIEEDLESLSKAIKILMKNDPSFMWNNLDLKEAYLQQMLKADKNTVDSLTKNYQSDIKNKQLIMIKSKNENELDLNKIKTHFKMYPFYHICVIDKGSLVCLCSTNYENAQQNEASKDFIINLVKDKNLKVSISYQFDDEEFIPLAYKQCEYVINKSNEDIALFEDYIDDCIIDNSLDKEEKRFYIHPGILKLDEYDKENNTEFLNTLFTYIDCLGDMRKAADNLYLHYNTLKYRMEKIENIMDINLKDNEELIHRLYLSKKIYLHK